MFFIRNSKFRNINESLVLGTVKENRSWLSIGCDFSFLFCTTFAPHVGLLPRPSGKKIRVSTPETVFASSYFNQRLISVEDYYPVPPVALILAVAFGAHPKASEPCGLESVFEHRSLAFLVYIYYIHNLAVLHILSSPMPRNDILIWSVRYLLTTSRNFFAASIISASLRCGW